MKINIAGLGPGSLDNISYKVYELLTQPNLPIYIRTKKHPVIDELEKKGMKAQYLDRFYEEGQIFEQVYESIVDYLIKEVHKHEEIIYAVPGHPYVAEQTVQMLQDKCKELNIEITAYPSMSFIDALFAAVKRDPSEGFELKDAFTLEYLSLDIEHDLVITQVYDNLIASETKLKLLEVYPDEHIAYIVKNAGIPDSESITNCKLYELDRLNIDYDYLTSLYIPKVEHKTMNTLADLINIIKKLRGPNGCAWDKKQTHDSLKEHIVEEAIEVREAIENDDLDNLIEELGDVLLHIVFHSELGRESGYFNLLDITDGICKKLVFRHPHVFSDLEIDEKDIPEMWERLKKIEKSTKILKNSELEVD